MKKLIFICLPMLAVLGCKSDPYTGRPELVSKKPKLTKPVAPTYGLESPDIMPFDEGKTGEFFIRGWVPKPGDAIVDVADMPKGMSYDAKNGKVIWTPGFDAANDPSNASIVQRNYIITIRLGSTLEPVAFVEKKVIVQVNDVPQGMSFKNITGTTTFGTESTEMSQLVQFENLDYPAGPFVIVLDNFPAGTVVDHPNVGDTQFTIRFKPDYDFVTYANNTTWSPLSREIYGNITVYDPRGRKLFASVKWSVADTRIAPLITGPTSTDQGLAANFVMIVEDVNGEYPPEIYTYDTPAFGDYKVTSTTVAPGTGVNPRRIVEVKWNKIPASYAGTTQNIKFTFSDYSDYYKRTTQTVAVKLTATTPEPLAGPISVPVEVTSQAFKPAKILSQKEIANYEWVGLEKMPALMKSASKIDTQQTGNGVAVLVPAAGCETVLALKSKLTGEINPVALKCGDKLMSGINLEEVVK
jgi:hypothetical protein